MAYILYINGHDIEIDSKAIVQTRQVNDLANLDSRQSSYTNKFIAPLTPKNVKAMEFVYMVGNQSNIPYQKNTASLYDADSGVCLIYNGWATITQSTKKGYDIFIYDGIIDFYRAIENKTLTDIGISGLNHAKSVTNIVASWANTMPYIYAIADYNGKNKFITTTGTHIEINTDYQVPSARVSYIWSQIHLFAGFTYTGAYFSTQKFLNWFMSFPKPVPMLVPHRILIYTGNYYPKSSSAWNPNEYGQGTFAVGVGGFHNYYLQTLPRENFSNAYTSVTNYNSTTAVTGGGAVYNHNYINILIAGTYSIDIPLTINANYFRKDSSGTIVDSGTVVADPTGTFKTYLFVCNLGDKIYFVLSDPEIIIMGLNFEWKLNRIDGFEANFEDAFVDFSAIDFVKEVIQQAGLTAFKDKYSNNIEYLTMSEILQSNNIEDWSFKFQYKDIEKYKLGKYAKRNNFKYRYNTENENHNDSYLTINDENLADEVDVLISKIYSPEKDTVEMLYRQVNVFKIWEKELQDDSTIKYKDLSGRYYFLRFEMIYASAILASESLNIQQAVSYIGFASYTGLKFSEILSENYSAIGTILDKAKVIDGYFYLTSIDIERFNFKSLIYVEQIASYYLVNKINNFTKGKVTKCEIIEVDYQKSFIIPPIATFITITNIEVDHCQLTISFDTDAVLPISISIDGTRAFLVLPNTDTDFYYSTFIATTNLIVISVPYGGVWSFILTVAGVISNSYSINNVGLCSYTPATPTLSALRITNLETLSVVGGIRNIRVHYTSNLSFGSMHLICTALNIGAPFTFDFYLATQNGSVDIAVANTGLGGGAAIWTIQLQAFLIFSNTITS